MVEDWDMPVQLDEWGAFVERVAQDGAADTCSGPLAGVRLAVKDNIAVAGLKWTAGLPLHAQRRATSDADSVATLRAAGARIVGVVATDAAGFGMTTPGVSNPLDKSLTVGGSSGGSAAAVAAGLADVALGTDTAGSVRVPAACCGLWGFKPRRGRVSTRGVTPLSQTFDHVGLLARDLDVMSRAASVLLAEPLSEPKPRTLVIGFDPYRLEGVADDIAEAVLASLILLGAAGHDIRELRIPDRDALIDAHGIITCAEARTNWAAHWPHDARLLGDTVRRTLEYAQGIADSEVAEARAVIAQLGTEIDTVVGQVDIVLGPTLRVSPPPAGARRVRCGEMDVPVVRALLSETCVFNASGHPALSLPLRERGHGVPVSLQLAAREDMSLLAGARIITQALTSHSGTALA